jgi:hypothetical protein
MMGRMKEHLVSRGYNLRERANIYAGAALGFVAPIAATRYLLFHDMGDGPVREAALWGMAAVANVGISLATTLFSDAPGVPLLYSTAVGAGFGAVAATNLRRERIKKEHEEMADRDNGLILSTE